MEIEKIQVIGGSKQMVGGGSEVIVHASLQGQQDIYRYFERYI